MITKMTKYSFILLSGEEETFLKKLQETGVVDITRSKKPVDAASSAMLEKAGEIKKAISLLKKTDYSKDDDCQAIMEAAESARIPEDAVSASIATVAELEKLKLRLDQVSKETGERLPWGDFNPADIRKLEDSGYVVRWYKTARKNSGKNGRRNALCRLWKRTEIMSGSSLCPVQKRMANSRWTRFLLPKERGRNPRRKLKRLKRRLLLQKPAC